MLQMTLDCKPRDVTHSAFMEDHSYCLGHIMDIAVVRLEKRETAVKRVSSGYLVIIQPERLQSKTMIPSTTRLGGRNHPWFKTALVNMPKSGQYWSMQI